MAESENGITVRISPSKDLPLEANQKPINAEPQLGKPIKIYTIKLKKADTPSQPVVAAQIEPAATSGINKEDIQKLVADSIGAQLGKLVETIASSVEAKLSPSLKKRVLQKRRNNDGTQKHTLAKQIKIDKPLPSSNAKNSAPGTSGSGRSKTREYSGEDVNSAIEAVLNEDWTVRKASKTFNVPRSTLANKMRMVTELGAVPDIAELTKSPGPRPIYGVDTEEELKKFVLQMLERSFPCNHELLCDSIMDIAVEKGSVENIDALKKPSSSWCHRFLDRHPELKGILSAYHPRANKKEGDEEWRSNLWTRLVKLGCEDLLSQLNRVFTLDEIAVPFVDSKICRRNESRWFYCSNKDAVRQACICFSAAGTLTPPFLTFPETKKAFTVVQGVWATIAPQGWIKSDTRYINIVELKKHFIAKNLLNPNDNNKKILLLVDGHASPISYKIFHFCEDAGIILWSLPPKSKITKHPADAAVETIQAAWTTILKRQQNPSPSLMTALHFSSMFKDALGTLERSPAILKKSFKECGIAPFNMVSISADFPDIVQSAVEEDTVIEPDVVPVPLESNCQYVDEKALVGGFNFFCSFLPPKKLKQFQSGKGNGKLHEIWKDWSRMVDEYTSGKGDNLKS
ncbi:uncharacterized protein LOC132203935 [Neocloeon triangulifer]|uniref:uncharacterized protein LOC132203935 n=1 Tax=Neocloeon triangulifer TaxID=2078957 RepID=UPI00286F1F2E|nr:uncharacterized protein LOC132203935 [Neocloeon triangulifer]XP_059488091.1 uncharacterized protein LOC132203935 [Neocloeon triangulifer]